MAAYALRELHDRRAPPPRPHAVPPDRVRGRRLHPRTCAGIEHTDDEVSELVNEITRLDPFPEVVQALSELKSHGLKLFILSNGDPDMLAAGVPHSGTEHLWDRVMSVAEADSFKPHQTTYHTATSLIGLARGEVLFVANHAFDCIGAKAAGLRSAFIDRRKRPFGNDRYVPDVTVSDMAELANILKAEISA
ncbi:HAD-IA family hydrolase [Nocardioidaceae bacterium SCSIO 66511]|nr:HAD-IA family hydrolase [Nocardioidaceae bacterium SCSIO 66511]